MIPASLRRLAADAGFLARMQVSAYRFRWHHARHVRSLMQAARHADGMADEMEG